MTIDFSDILTSIAVPPLWWHEDVPRYVPFHPKWVSIHAREAILLRSACQSCGAIYASSICGYTEELEIAEQIGRGALPGFDPPLALRHCGENFTSSLTLRVLEYWRKDNTLREWRRMTEFEVDLPDADEFPTLRTEE